MPTLEPGPDLYVARRGSREAATELIAMAWLFGFAVGGHHAWPMLIVAALNARACWLVWIKGAGLRRADRSGGATDADH